MRKKREEILKVTRVPCLPGVRVVTGTGIDNDFAKHIHGDLCVGTVTGGARVVTVRGRSWTVGRGDIFVINPGEPHVCRSFEGKPHSYTVIVIDEAVLRGIMKEDGGAVVFENFIPADSELCRRMTELADALLRSDAVLEKESLLYSFIETLVRCHSEAAAAPESGSGSRAVGPVREYLDANCTAPVTLEDLSRIAGLSPYHLNRLFCAEVGIAPHTYQLHRRIEKSKALLLSGMSIADAALESGFSDQSHFSKFFRKITGTTPGHFAACNAQEKERG